MDLSDPFLSTKSNETSFYTGHYSFNPNTSPKEVGGQFEAIFYRMMLKDLSQPLFDEDPMLDSNTMSQVKEMQYEELASTLGQAGQLKIGTLIETELEKQKNAIKISSLARGA